MYAFPYEIHSTLFEIVGFNCQFIFYRLVIPFLFSICRSFDGFQAVIVEVVVGVSTTHQSFFNCIYRFLGVCTLGCLVVGSLLLANSGLAIVYA